MYGLCYKPALVYDFNIHSRLLRQQIVCNDSCNQVCHEVVDRSVSGVLYMADVLQLVVDGLYAALFLSSILS